MIINVQVTALAMQQPVNAYVRPENTCITINAKVIASIIVVPTKTYVQLSQTEHANALKDRVHLYVNRPKLVVLRRIISMETPAKRMMSRTADPTALPVQPRQWRTAKPSAAPKAVIVVNAVRRRALVVTNCRTVRVFRDRFVDVNLDLGCSMSRMATESKFKMC